MQADEIVTLARSWLGTPYHNMTAIKGQGCDCLGLLRGVFAEVTGDFIETPVYSSRPPKSAPANETMLEAARKYLEELPACTRGPGIVLVFRVHPKMAAWHCGIMTDEKNMVHAHSGRQAYEVTLGPRWNKRVVAAFKFPGMND